MNDRNALEVMVRRTRGYWYEDGLWEMAAGGSFVILSLFLAMQAVAPSGSELRPVFALGGAIFIVGSSVIARWFVERVKARLTYPRTGYVRYGREAQRAMLNPRIVRGIVGGALGAFFAGISLRWWETALPLFFGLYSGLLLTTMGYSMGLGRFRVLAAWSVAAGLVITAFSLPAVVGTAIFWAAQGLGLLASGLSTQRRYLESAPALHESERYE